MLQGTIQSLSEERTRFACLPVCSAHSICQGRQSRQSTRSRVLLSSGLSIFIWFRVDFLAKTRTAEPVRLAVVLCTSYWHKSADFTLVTYCGICHVSASNVHIPRFQLYICFGILYIWNVWGKLRRFTVLHLSLVRSFRLLRFAVYNTQLKSFLSPHAYMTLGCPQIPLYKHVNSQLLRINMQI